MSRSTHPTPPPHDPSPARPPGKPWSVGELAAYLGCSERHVWRLISRGGVRTIPLGRRKTAIPDDEVRRLVTQGTR